MEKRKPTYDLESFKAAFCTPDKLVATGTALTDARYLGFSRQNMVDAIQSMKRSQFFKSMTSLNDHTEWQDVYHVQFGDFKLYVKFTADRITVFRLLSFKEK